jgi:hypothetical protein
MPDSFELANELAEWEEKLKRAKAKEAASASELAIVNASIAKLENRAILLEAEIIIEEAAMLARCLDLERQIQEKACQLELLRYALERQASD